jgi:hypothetical protein
MNWSVVDHFTLNVQTLPSRDRQIFEKCLGRRSECWKHCMSELQVMISVPVVNNWVCAVRSVGCERRSSWSCPTLNSALWQASHGSCVHSLYDC